MNHFALVKLEHRIIAFTHHHIATIERCKESINDITVANNHWAIQDLDDDLFWRPKTFYSAPFVICFKQFPLALRCADVDSIQNADTVPLPPIMQGTDTLVTGLIAQPSQLIFVVDLPLLISRQSEDREMLRAT